MEIFDTVNPFNPIPLADRVRPRSVDDFQGHEEWMAEDKPLALALKTKRIPSLIFWGPPGCGKTTLARILSHMAALPYEFFSAVNTSIKDVREIMEKAREEFEARGKPTLLFIDEIHRFNRAQQDAFLPFVEAGQIILIGATTENPSFQVNSALLSRLQVINFKPLREEDLVDILKRALKKDSAMHTLETQFSSEVLDSLALSAQGDARCALNRLEALGTYIQSVKKPMELTPDNLSEILNRALPRYDKDRDQHFDLISALHKSLRNSDVQASLYWLARMIDGGEDPLYIARRLIRFASEDIGMAEPECLSMTLVAKDACHFVGLPECKLALAQAVVALSVAPKSNALYSAYKKIEKDLMDGKNYEVPMHIRNAPTRLMKDIGYGKDYVYAHDEEVKTSKMSCLPDKLRHKVYFRPGEMGYEKTIKQRMDYWKNLKRISLS